MRAIFNNWAHHNGVVVLLDAANDSPPSPPVVRLLNIPHLSFTPLIGNRTIKKASVLHLNRVGGPANWTVITLHTTQELGWRYRPVCRTLRQV